MSDDEERALTLRLLNETEGMRNKQAWQHISAELRRAGFKSELVVQRDKVWYERMRSGVSGHAYRAKKMDDYMARYSGGAVPRSRNAAKALWQYPSRLSNDETYAERMARHLQQERARAAKEETPP
jgi:hypothetical protein